jgi:hypothetical protein
VINCDSTEDAEIKFTIKDEDMGEDDLVGDCCVELSRLLKPGQNDFPVKYNKKLAGKLEWTT